LNNSPQIEAAADGRPVTRCAENSRSNGAARRVWRLGWKTREFGDQGWRAREFGDLVGKARVPCAKADNGTPPDFGLSRELWTGRRSATSRQWSGTQACHQNQRDGSSGQNIGWKRFLKDKWVKQESRTLDPKWSKRKISVSGGPIQGRRALAAGSVDQEGSNRQDQLGTKVISRSTK